MFTCKRIPGLISAAVVIGFLFSGCATTPEPADAADAPSLTGYSSAPDSRAGRYIGAVNREARRQGVRVEWVNPPRDEDLERPRRTQTNN